MTPSPQEQMAQMTKLGKYLFMFLRAYNGYKRDYDDKRPQEQFISDYLNENPITHLMGQIKYLDKFLKAFNFYSNTYLDKRLPKQFIEEYLEEYQIPDAE